MSTSLGNAVAEKVNLLSLASSALASCVAASRPIRKLASMSPDETNDEVRKSVSRHKLDGSIVTDADGQAQHIIASALRSLCPNIRIVGEESQQEVDRHIPAKQPLHSDDDDHDEAARTSDSLPATSTSGLDETSSDVQVEMEERLREELMGRITLSTSLDVSEGDTGETSPPDSLLAFPAGPPLGKGTMSSYEIDASRVAIFIDPLDGTNSYAKGEYDVVTILVGIIVDDHPCFGVICKPFGQLDQPTLPNSGIFAIYGGTLIDGLYITGGGECAKSAQFKIDRLTPKSERLDPNNQSHDARAVISKSRSKGVVRDCIDDLSSRGLLHPEPVYVSGAGEKALRLLVGSKHEALWFFPKPGTSLWDVAAADALLRSVGGRLTDKNGHDIDYSKSRQEAENINGIIACNDARLHSECIRLFLEGNWKD